MSASPTPPHNRLALVTGGAGFIGSHLVRLLLQSGWRVRVLDNLSTGQAGNLPIGDAGLEFRTGDIRDVAAVCQACMGIEAVFHLAALVSVIESIKSPRLAEEINVQGTTNVFSAAAAAGARRIVFSSSCAVYGDGPTDPQQEKLPTAPASPYAATKLAGEKLAETFTAQGKLSVICLRYFNVYGPRQNPKSDYAAVVPRFLSLALAKQTPTIYGDGQQTRDFVFVGDVARANLRAAEIANTLPAPAVFNVGIGQATSVNTLWKQIAAITGYDVAPNHAPARAGEVLHSRADITRIRDSLGFVPTCSLAEGLRATASALEPATRSR